MIMTPQTYTPGPMSDKDIDDMVSLESECDDLKESNAKMQYALIIALAAIEYHEQNTATLRGIIASGKWPWPDVQSFDAAWQRHGAAYAVVTEAIKSATK